MDLLDTLLYTLARMGLMLMLVLFSAFAGEVLLPSVATFLPYSALSFKEFITDPTVCSAAGMIIICLIFIWVFYDDGKRHTAYENWSVVNILTVLLVMLIIYFVPAIFRDSFHSEGKAEVFYMVLYYPAGWISRKLGAQFLSAVTISSVMMLATAFIAYFTAYKIYTKKHPSLSEEARAKRKLAELAAEPEEDEEDEDL